MFSKKATKIEEIFTSNLTLCSKRQINGEDFVNFRGLLRKYELYEARTADKRKNLVRIIFCKNQASAVTKLAYVTDITIRFLN